MQGQERLCCQWGFCAEKQGLPGQATALLGLNPPPCLAATCAGACCPLSPPSSSVSQLSDCWQTCQTSCWKPGHGWQVSARSRAVVVRWVGGWCNLEGPSGRQGTWTIVVIP